MGGIRRAMAVRGTAALAAAVALLTATPAIAGPPYDTDDPEPTDQGGWEIYVFGTASRAPGRIEGVTGLDLNYGAAPGVQLTATLPIEVARENGTRFGGGNVEVGVKYRFFHDEDAGFSIAAFPRLILPTASRGFGTGKTVVQLPVWAQKDMGDWSLFGGGGYTINPGPGNRNFWRGGIALTRTVTPRLTLGAEATWSGPEARGERPVTTLGLGGTYRLKGPFSILLSAGPTFERGSRVVQTHAYAGLALSF